ncbi:MAG: GntR family transcriptional regulator, partial [Spirochaetia bacterium]
MVVLEKLKVEISEQEKNQPIHQWVYQILRSNIIKLHLKPAQRISENEVSEALGVSRTPVREAFIRLAEDGLIKITPQKRSIVSLIDLDQADEARFIRRALEKAVIKEASGRMSGADRAELISNIETQRQCQRKKDYDHMLAVDN